VREKQSSKQCAKQTGSAKFEGERHGLRTQQEVIADVNEFTRARFKRAKGKQQGLRPGKYI
jgi:hypothetical protein